MAGKKYSANLTGASFLFYEIKQVAKLINEGLSEDGIKTKIVDEKLFQYNKISSVTRALPTVYRRANLLSHQLRDMLINEDTINGKLINLFAIMEEDLLFKELMMEVIKEKYNSENLFIERKDINSFFTQKSEQDEGFSKYTEGTRNKLRQVHLKILMEAGILKDLKSGQLNRILLDTYLTEVLIDNDAEYFINIFK